MGRVCQYLVCLIIPFLLTRDATADCAETVKRKLLGLSNSTAQYLRELKETYGARFFIRDVPLEEQAIDRKLLGFWVERNPGEFSVTGPALDRIEKWLGQKPDTHSKKYRFDFFGGLDHTLSSPVRVVSKRWKTLGYIENEKSLTIPSAMALSYPVLTGSLNTLKEINEENHRRHLTSIYNSDYRVDSIVRKTNKSDAELDRLQKSGADPRVIEETRKNHFEKALKDVEVIEGEYKSYFALAAQFKDRYQKVGTQNTRALDQERVAILADHPLFRDIPSRLGIETKGDLLKDGTFEIAEPIFQLRELLYLRYSLIASVVEGGPALEKLKTRPEFSNQIYRIKASPLAQSLRDLYEKKLLSREAFQRALMEDSFWELERFGVWKILGQTPPKLDSNDKPTNEPLTLNDIRKEIWDSILIENGLTGRPR